MKCHFKPGKKDNVLAMLREQVPPVLQKQPGFVDMVGLTDEHDPNHTISITFWKTREDAERYQREHLENTLEKIRAALAEPPTIRTYDVEMSTTHRIASGKAA